MSISTCNTSAGARSFASALFTRLFRRHLADEMMHISVQPPLSVLDPISTLILASLLGARFVTVLLPTDRTAHARTAIVQLVWAIVGVLALPIVSQWTLRGFLAWSRGFDQNTRALRELQERISLAEHNRLTPAVGASLVKDGSAFGVFRASLLRLAHGFEGYPAILVAEPVLSSAVAFVLHLETVRLARFDFEGQVSLANLGAIPAPRDWLRLQGDELPARVVFALRDTSPEDSAFVFLGR